MREINYKNFSWRTHKENWNLNRINICQYELTFGCELHCFYCYASCYNSRQFIKNELTANKVKLILDKLHKAGVIWLCFTGGDPLTRKDFLDIYLYAKKKGFIIIIFTSAYSITKKIVQYFKKAPPFVIEVTLNAVTRDLYEKISQVRSSFNNTMEGIKLILNAGLALKIKTQIFKDNLRQIPEIKKFIEGISLKFYPDYNLHARLNGDLTPKRSRIYPYQALCLTKNNRQVEAGCNAPSTDKYLRKNNNLFHCTIGSGDGIYIDPYGNLIPCICLRDRKISLLKEDINKAHQKILTWIRTRQLNAKSKCSVCNIKFCCYNCPGKSFLEKGNLSGSVDWFCELAHLTQEVPFVR